MNAKDIVKLTPQEIEEKWATQDYHQYKPKSHEAVEAEWMYGDNRSAEDLLIEQEEQEENKELVESKLSLLTEREREVVELLYSGPSLTHQEVASQLNISRVRVTQLFNSALVKMA